MTKKLTEKQAVVILRNAGFKRLPLKKMTLEEAEKMGLEYWNEALEIAASIVEDYAFTGLRGREYAIVPAVKELIAKAIRKQKAKAR